MSNDSIPEIALPLDERNLAHILSATAFAALILRIPEAHPFESTCWWEEREFRLKTAIGDAALFANADNFLRKIQWVSGVGGEKKRIAGKEQGTFAADKELGSNPFISFADNGQDKSPLKTFAANQEPAKDLLDKQQERLQPPDRTSSWLCQITHGISSWGFDSRVGSHAYDQGFSSNDEGSGERDPIYPAIELLSIAAASFFTAIQGWQADENTLRYGIWSQPVSLSLVPYMVTGRLHGFPVRRYRIATRGGAYGKGAAFRFFPEATLDNSRIRKGYERRTGSRKN